MAIVRAVDKFWHYLVGAHFTLETDHKPLLWLESAKRSRAHSQRLGRWSLELRAYDFDMVHKPSLANQYADALSRKPINLVGICSCLKTHDIAQAQRQDPELAKVADCVEGNAHPPTPREWLTYSLKCYRQLWSQLTLEDSMICRKLKFPTMEQEKLVILVPKSLKRTFLCNAHVRAGHQGSDRTLTRLAEVATGWGWRDVAQHCRICVKCQVTVSYLQARLFTTSGG